MSLLFLSFPPSFPLVIKQDTLFTSMAVDIVAEPKQIFNTPGNIVVFVKSGTDYYVKAFSKVGLGLK